jgi:thiamine biosynthesis lipoprotein ApbE
MTRSDETAEDLVFRALAFKALAFKALGTVVSLIVTDGAARAAAFAILGEELSTVDAACSRFRAGSELSQLNRQKPMARASRWVPSSHWPEPG